MPQVLSVVALHRVPPFAPAFDVDEVRVLDGRFVRCQFNLNLIPAHFKQTMRCRRALTRSNDTCVPRVEPSQRGFLRGRVASF